MTDGLEPCRICGGATSEVGWKRSAYSGRDYRLGRCETCRFAFVCNPWLDYGVIYGDDYYSGRGADPLVNYVDEANHADLTIRQYEWRGVWRTVSRLVSVGDSTRWLDFGCGVGGLVAFLRRQGLDHALGFEQGWSVSRLIERGIPHIGPDDLAAHAGTFDVVTAIEVLEHAVDPLDELRRIRALLAPGGVLFLTTGNPAPYRDRLLDWAYVMPDVHVSFFEPTTLDLALHRAGFDTSFPGYGPGWGDIIRFKVLKSLRRGRVSWWEQALPWPAISRIVDRRLGVSAQPVGWAT